MRLLSAELVLPITRAPLKNSAVAIEDGKIIELGPRTELKKKYPSADESHFPLLMPGLINAHTHLELSGIPLISQHHDFVDWMVKLIAQKRELSPQKMENDSAAEFSKFAKLGVTSVGDVASHPVMLNAHRKSPLWSTLFFELIGVREEDVLNRISLARTVLGEFNYRLGNSRPGLSLHAPFTVSKPLYLAGRKLAAEHNLALCTHLAESREETDFLMRGSGPIADRLYPFVGWQEFKPKPALCSPAQYLNDLIDENMTLIHCVEISDDDLEIIARARAIVHCPRSNLNLTGKLAPIPKMIAAGATVALGTDSPASAGDDNLWSEMKKVLELRDQYPGGKIKPSDILKMSTINAARAIFREHELGSITPGKTANLLALNLTGLPDDPEKLSEELIISGERNISAVFWAGVSASL